VTKSDCERTQEEIEQLLNDPETPMHPDRIWALAEALAEGKCAGTDLAWDDYSNSPTP
jgi:hypothetical protein